MYGFVFSIKIICDVLIIFYKIIYNKLEEFFEKFVLIIDKCKL